MDKKITNVHDKFFKSTFGDIEVATDFLNNYLPSEVLEVVDLSTIEVQNGSFVDKKFKEQFSDLLFRVDINDKDGYIYFLFEHKSYNDRLTILQLLRYMVEIWESKIGKEKKDGLPMIMPLLIYHNKGKWTANTKLGDWIEGYNDLPKEMKKYIPNYEYMLHDLSEYNEEEIRASVVTKITMKLLSRARDATTEEITELFKEVIGLLIEIELTDGMTNIVEACIRYVLNVRDDITKEEFEEIAGEVTLEGSEFVMTVADKLREEGLEQGMQKGVEVGIKITAKTMIVEGESTEKIMRYTKLTREDIEGIKEEMIN